MQLGGLNLADAVRMATTNAARAGKVPERTRGLVAGERADFVLFDFDPERKTIQMRTTFVSGRRVWG
jgi:predicted amidohydrolase YtcJ